MTGLDAAVERIASAGVLLVACDYDGTLAELVDDPDQAWPVPASVDALRDLAAVERTHVAVISGRARADLVTLSGLEGHAVLVGSHGAEGDPAFAERLEPEQRQRLAALAAGLAGIAEHHEGARLEHKPAAVVLHYRTVAPERAGALLADVDAWLVGHPDSTVMRGKQVVELMVTDVGKGEALARLRTAIGAEAVLFAGDDLTDEDAFAVLGGGDVTIKVGGGASRARWRVDGPADLATVLARLLRARST